jgi:predicted permease
MPDWTSAIRTGFAAEGHEPDADVVEELTQHAEATYEAARADGRTHDEAVSQVHALLSSWCREASSLRRRPRRAPIVEAPAGSPAVFAGTLRDAQYAVRLLRRQPGYALVVILTMALGIGATTTLFSVAYGVLMRPLPWADADRLVRLTETRQGSTRARPWVMTNGTYLALQEHSSTIEGLAAWSTGRLTVTGTDRAERLRMASVSPSIFPLLRAQAMLGSVFRVEDDRTPLAVLSYGLWQQRYGADPNVVGRSIQLDGEVYTIVGVMARDFVFPDRDTQVWLPMHVPPVVSEDGKGHLLSMFFAIARLRPGATPAQAAAEATTRARHAPDSGLTAMAVFGSNGPVEVQAVPALDALTRDVKPALLVFLVAVGLLLATATMNVASLQLARATVRRREIAIRSALGAGAGRITQQLLVESLLLGLMGGAGGLLMTAALHRALPALMPADFPRLDAVAIDAGVAAFAVLLALATSIACGLMPALHAGRVNLVEALTEDGQAPIGGSGRSRAARARLVIMAGQIAVACVLLVGAALLTRSFVAMIAADRGYNPTNVLTARVPMPSFAYTPQRRAAVLAAVAERLRAVPGVRHAAFTDMLPLTPSENISAFTVPARGSSGGATVTIHAVRPVVSEDYFAALGIRLIDGRGLTEADTDTSQPVMVVNRTFAKRYLGDSPIGERLSHSAGDGREREVVGIVEDTRQQNVTDPVQPMFFLPYRQFEDGLRTAQPSVVVRTDGDPRTLIPTLTSLVHEQDPSLALESVMTMEDRVRTGLARPRLYAVLLGGFATFALAIAAVGLFGVLSYSVAQRVREIGVRTALGARPRDIVGLVLKQAVVVMIGGLAGGLWAALALVRYLSTFLYGVTAHDTVSFVMVPIGLAIVAAVACVVPARRAARVDPLRALRQS